MSKTDDQTILLQAAPAPEFETTAPTKLEFAIRRRMFQFLGVSLLVVGVIAFSWAAWHFLHSNSRIEDDDLIADMDGFEPVSSTADPLSKVESARDRLAVPQPDDMSSISNASIGLPELPANLSPMNSPTVPSIVWLTGTIEDTDASVNAKLPLRLSGEPNESLILR